MPAYKVDYFFNASHADGWTETFYLSAGDTATALSQATAGVNSYVNTRRGILHAAFNLSEVRVSDVAITRDSLVKVYSQADGQGLYGDKATLYEQAWDGMLLRGEAGPQTRRAIHIRGLPSGQIDPIGGLTLNGVFINRLDSWIRAIGPGFVGFSIRKQTATLVDRPIQCDILGDNKAIRLTWAARPAGVTVGTFLNVKKVDDASNVNGRWRVQYTDATTATMYPKLTKMYGTPSTAVARVETVAITFPNITAVIAERGVKLNTGRPSDAPHGRRTRRAA